jgi:hypothetical protein
MELENPLLYWDFCIRDFPGRDCEVAWVVNDTADLKWAVRNRRRLKAAELWAGPNLVVVPQEADAILTSDTIDRVIVPARWVSDVYSEAHPPLKSRISIWPASIDTDYWASAGHETKRQWLIYNKNQDELAGELRNILRQFGVDFTEIRYGRYSPIEYRNLLRTAFGLIWLSESESEGIALLEALSMNVPALVWDRGYWEYESRELKRKFTAPATSAPYFSESCGCRFTDVSRFQSTFETFRRKSQSYHPRQYILESSLDLESNKKRIITLMAKKTDIATNG